MKKSIMITTFLPLNFCSELTEHKMTLKWSRLHCMHFSERGMPSASLTVSLEEGRLTVSGWKNEWINQYTVWVWSGWTVYHSTYSKSDFSLSSLTTCQEKIRAGRIAHDFPTVCSQSHPLPLCWPVWRYLAMFEWMQPAALCSTAVTF